MSTPYFLQKTPHAVMLCKGALLLGRQTSMQRAYAPLHARKQGLIGASTDRKGEGGRASLRRQGKYNW